MSAEDIVYVGENLLAAIRPALDSSLSFTLGLPMSSQAHRWMQPRLSRRLGDRLGSADLQYLSRQYLID